MESPGIALQLWTVRQQARADFVGTLRQVAALGYRAIETGDFGGLTAAELKPLLDRDMTGGPEPGDAEFGEGAVDFPGLFAVARGVEWYIVELDKYPRPAFEGAAASLRQLRSWLASDLS